MQYGTSTFVCAQSFTVVVDDSTAESLSGALVFEVSGKMVEKKTKTKVRKGHAAKATNITSLKRELEESTKTLGIVQRVLNTEGKSIEQLVSVW